MCSMNRQGNTMQCHRKYNHFLINVGRNCPVPFTKRRVGDFWVSSLVCWEETTTEGEQQGEEAWLERGSWGKENKDVRGREKGKKRRMCLLLGWNWGPLVVIQHPWRVSEISWRLRLRHTCAPFSGSEEKRSSEWDTCLHLVEEVQTCADISF